MTGDRADREFPYGGQELQLFERAANWRNYWTSLVSGHLGTSVLEVGAGIGTVTRSLCSGHHEWTAVEPDRTLVDQAYEFGLPLNVRTVVGTVHDVSDARRFDSVIYADVLEHISADWSELNQAGKLLVPGGHLIVLVPAHNLLFSRFDAQVGHHRRYSRKLLAAAVPPSFETVTVRYLDSLGLLVSGLNRFLLRKSLPRPAEIAFWDSLMVPLSQRLDPMFNFHLGKSLLGIWKKPWLQSSAY